MRKRDRKTSTPGPSRPPHVFATTNKNKATLSAFHTTIMAEDPLHILMRALRDHDLPCDREVIKSAFADPETQTAVQDWVDEYLSPETLLTKDEANL